MALPDTTVSKKQDVDYLPYGIRFNPIDTRDNFVRIRYFEAIVLDSNFFVEGLNKLKKDLVHMQKRKEMQIEDLRYTNESRDKGKDLYLELDEMKLNSKFKGILTIQQLQTIRENMFRSSQSMIKIR